MSQSSIFHFPSNIQGLLAERLKSPEFVSTVLEHLPTGLLLVNKSYEVEYANPAASQLMGFQAGEMDGKPLDLLMGAHFLKLIPQDQDDPGRSDGLIMHGHSHYELHIKMPGGGERVVETVIADVFKEQSEHFLIYLTEITPRKKLAAELRQHSAFFQNLIDSSVDGIIAADMKGKLIVFNQGAQKMLGYTGEEALNSLHVTQLYPEGLARELMDHMRSEEYGGKGKLFRHKLTAVTKSGRMIPMSLSGGIVYDRGKETASFGIFTDLREIQKIEQDLEQTHKMLLQSEKMAGLGRLAAGVAHEINNPMSGIMLYSNLILEQLEEGDPIIEDLKVINNEAQRCKQIVADLLEFSHQTTYEGSGVDLNEQLHKALVLIVKQPLFHNIEIMLDLEEGLSRIWGNPIRLNQVLMNIIMNAAQAMEGKGTLTLTSRHRAYRDMVEVCIGDDGPGIDEKTLTQIFDPFFTTKVQGEGTGLGLSVSYAIVKEHKGTIRVESRVGEGATFYLRFPVLQQEMPEGDYE